MPNDPCSTAVDLRRYKRPAIELNSIVGLFVVVSAKLCRLFVLQRGGLRAVFRHWSQDLNDWNVGCAQGVVGRSAFVLFSASRVAVVRSRFFSKHLSRQL